MKGQHVGQPQDEEDQPLIRFHPGFSKPANIFWGVVLSIPLTMLAINGLFPHHESSPLHEQAAVATAPLVPHGETSWSLFASYSGASEGYPIQSVHRIVVSMQNDLSDCTPSAPTYCCIAEVEIDNIRDEHEGRELCRRLMRDTIGAHISVTGHFNGYEVDELSLDAFLSQVVGHFYEDRFGTLPSSHIERVRHIERIRY